MLAIFKMKDMWKYVSLIIVFAFIMLSMKRGAILVGTVALLLYLKHHLKAKSEKQFIYLLLLSLITILVIYMFVTRLYETSDYFRMRVGSTIEGDTSRRSWIYSHYFDFYIYQTSSLEFLFGCGADATFFRFGQYAHNDWLEFAINEGVFGIILYVIYWILFIREWKHFRGRIELKQTIGDLIIVYFLISLFSMSFDGMPLATSLCIGYCLANNRNYKNLASFIDKRQVF
jgi:hypothetical protein